MCTCNTWHQHQHTLRKASEIYVSQYRVRGWFVHIQTSLFFYDDMWSHNNNEVTFCHSLCHIHKYQSLTGEILTLLIFTFPFDISENQHCQSPKVILPQHYFVLLLYRIQFHTKYRFNFHNDHMAFANALYNCNTDVRKMITFICFC